MKYSAILFDFDGVLVESEYVSTRQIAATLTEIGYPTTPEQAGTAFTGLAQAAFHEAVAAWIGGPVPQAFHEARAREDARVLAEGIEAVAGAVAFVRTLPADLPTAIVSSSSTAWITAHLRHIGLADRFVGHIYSGREHVARGKPAPDLYLLAAERLGVAIADTVILEDSAVGATGAVASGATVIGLTAGRHCGPGHADRLRALGVSHVASSFEDVAALVA